MRARLRFIDKTLDEGNSSFGLCDGAALYHFARTLCSMSGSYLDMQYFGQIKMLHKEAKNIYLV